MAVYDGMSVYGRIGAVNLATSGALRVSPTTSYSGTKAAQREALLLGGGGSSSPAPASSSVALPVRSLASDFIPASDEGESGGIPRAVIIAGGIVAVLAVAAVIYKAKKR